jgi:predicted nucleic acid-binding protein
MVDLVLGREPEASWVADHLRRGTGRLRAPHLLDIEVIGALRRLERRQEITAPRASRALSDLLELRLERYPHSHLLTRVWQLRPNLTVSDATYISLSEALKLPFLTTDRALAGATGHRARVVVFPDEG